MFEKIILAVDGSEHSVKAVPVAAEVAKKFGSEVIVVHVFERTIGRGGIYELETPADASEVVDEAVRQLKDSGMSAGGRFAGPSRGSRLARSSTSPSARVPAWW
jgi:nucleotide-binding universal stress UspA family protein